MAKAELKGDKELLAELEKRFGKAGRTAKIDQALLTGAKVFVEALIYEFATTPHKGYSTGATIDEITVSEPMWLGGERVVRIHWRGPDNRHRIIHLNEWGTIKNPNPPWKGVIARTMKNAQEAYRREVRKHLERSL